jgi:uncharacterized damage-inducible protein DinB
MTIAEQFIAELEAEAPTTRKFLERLPNDKLDWRPHPKSMTAGQLALHMATFPGPVVQMATLDEFMVPDFNRPNPQPESVQEILQKFDESVATAKQALSTISDQQMNGIWKMKAGDRELLAIPRSNVLRNILLNHWYHHRGQLGVYLRLLGAKVPSSYGPSGDEMPGFFEPASAGK